MIFNSSVRLPEGIMWDNWYSWWVLIWNPFSELLGGYSYTRSYISLRTYLISLLKVDMLSQMLPLSCLVSNIWTYFWVSISTSYHVHALLFIGFDCRVVSGQRWSIPKLRWLNFHGTWICSRSIRLESPKVLLDGQSKRLETMRPVILNREHARFAATKIETIMISPRFSGISH